VSERLTAGQINVSLVQGPPLEIVFNDFVDASYINVLDLHWKTHVVCCSGIDGIDATQISDFCRVGFVTVLKKNKVYGQRRNAVVCFTHLPYDPAYSSASNH
jgi:hypothetical protein